MAALTLTEAQLKAHRATHVARAAQADLLSLTYRYNVSTEDERLLEAILITGARLSLAVTTAERASK